MTIWDILFFYYFFTTILVAMYVAESPFELSKGGRIVHYIFSVIFTLIWPVFAVIAVIIRCFK